MAGPTRGTGRPRADACVVGHGAPSVSSGTTPSAAAFFTLLDSRALLGRSSVLLETADSRRLFSTALAIFQVFPEHIFPCVSLPRFSFGGSTTAKPSALVGALVAANQCARPSHIVQDTSAGIVTAQGAGRPPSPPRTRTRHCSTRDVHARQLLNHALSATLVLGTSIIHEPPRCANCTFPCETAPRTKSSCPRNRPRCVGIR